MKYYVINLARSPERYAAFKEKADRTGLEIERIEGIDGKKQLPEGVSSWRSRWLYGHEVQPGHVGLVASLDKVLQIFLASEESFALICEDDVDLPENLPEILGEILEYRSSWDIVRLNGLRETFHFPNHLFPIQKMKSCNSSFCMNFGWFGGTGAYLLNRKTAEIILRHSKPFFLPEDHFFARLPLYGVRQFITFPYPVVLNEFSPKTTIEAKTRRPFWKKLFYLPYITSLPYRGLMELLAWFCQAYRLIEVHFHPISSEGNDSNDSKDQKA